MGHKGHNTMEEAQVRDRYNGNCGQPEGGRGGGQLNKLA